MKPNRIREVLAEGRTCVGHMLMEFQTRGTVQILDAAGADFALIDMEHSGFTLGDVGNLLAWLKATDVSPIVRVPANEYHFIARVMDAGAHGVMIPNVRSAEEAIAAQDAMRYAPLGGRGLGLGSAHNDYRPPQPVEYMAEANQRNFLICQIESQQALDDLDEVAATQGVDCLWVGHFDLTQSMGIVAEFDNPRFVDALRKVAETAKGAGLAAGIQPGSLEQAQQWVPLGYNLISYGADHGVYRKALTDGVAAVRGIA